FTGNVVGTGLWTGSRTRAPKHAWSAGRGAGGWSLEIPAAETPGLSLDIPSAPLRWIAPSPKSPRRSVPRNRSVRGGRHLPVSGAPRDLLHQVAVVGRAGPSCHPR